MSKDKVFINWEYRGKADFLLGTGATKAEQVLVWIASLAGVGLYVYFYLENALSWTWWQYLLAGIFAFDVAGGVVANNLNSCKRFYHTPKKTDEPPYTGFLKNHLVFSALHVHPIVIALIYGNHEDYLKGLFWYIALVIATFVILKIPLYLKRPASFLAILLALLINLYLVPLIHGFEWFVPALFIKILYGHLVREEPYRPPREEI